MSKLIFSLFILFSISGMAADNTVKCKKWHLVDPTSNLTFDAVVKSKEFEEVKDDRLTFGFSQYKHWLKVECKNLADADFSGKFQFLYPVVNDLNIYKDNSSIPIKLGFWERDRREKDHNTVLPEFGFELKAKASNEFFIEAKSNGSLQLQTRLVENSKGEAYLTKPSFFYGLFFGALLALMLYNLFLGVSLKDHTYFYYCGYVLFFFLYQITITGYGPTFFGEIGYRLADFRAAYLHSLFFFITMFARRFLLLKENSPWMSKLLIGISLVYASAVILSPILPIQGNLKFSAITSIIIPLILIFVATAMLKRGFKPARFFVTAWILFLGAIVITAMRNIGALPKVWIVDHILEFGIIGEVFLISLGLAFKVRLLEREKNLAASDAASEKLKVIELNAQLETEKIFSSISAQVSHDIRSPLSALTMISSSLIDIPEEKRLVIRNATQRINDIANQLLLKAKGTKVQSKDISDVTLELLPSIIDVIISEKRTQYRDKLGVEIDSDLRSSYGAFVNVNSAELKRVVSNLINNSVEAFEASKGKVLVTVFGNENNVTLIIEDNGKGIPADVLTKIGTYGFSFGKDPYKTGSGSGVGIYHAFKTIQSFGGKLDIESTPGAGTKVSITLPRAPTPHWFIAKLKLVPGQFVVCLDDDVSIHQIWKGRFDSLERDGKSIGIVHLSNGNDLKKWVESNESLIGNTTTFLIDFELLGQTATGLDLIEQLNLGSQAVLVTSRFEEPAIRTRCEKAGVKLIPKVMAGLVPIEFVAPKVKYDACLIDDDSLIHLSWKFAAEEAGVNFIGFDSFEAFLERESEIDKNTPISLDVDLGGNVSGIEIAAQIHKLGYSNIYLATGYDKEYLNSLPNYVIDVRNKVPQFL